jgi:hypothetical protein
VGGACRGGDPIDHLVVKGVQERRHELAQLSVGARVDPDCRGRLLRGGQLIADPGDLPGVPDPLAVLTRT